MVYLNPGAVQNLTSDSLLLRRYERSKIGENVLKNALIVLKGLRHQILCKNQCGDPSSLRYGV